MPTKIRLSRHGSKRRPFYHILVADSRAPRDGRFIERIGSYNPCTNPATIILDFDKALDWLQKGAQPTDTCRAILSYEGVLMKKHLLDGVKKGAFDEAAAEEKFTAWKKEKISAIQSKRDRLAKEKDADTKKRLQSESKVNQERAEAIAKKLSEMAAKEAKSQEEVSEEVTEEVSEEVTAEAESEVAEEAKEE